MLTFFGILIILIVINILLLVLSVDSAENSR